MTLYAVLDNLDDVPEALKEEYKEHEGKFYLDLDSSIQAHTSILPLARSLANVKKEKKDLAEKLRTAQEAADALPEDFDRDEYDRLVADEEKRKKDPNYKGGDANEHLAQQRKQYEQQIENLKTEHKKVLEDKDSEIEDLTDELSNTLKNDRLTASLVKSGIAPEFMKAATSMLRGQIKVVKDDDTGERRALVETDLGEIDVEKYIDTWSKSDEGKPFVAKGQGSGAPGSGKQASSEVNPWAKETRNLTLQGSILRADRQKAERLMKAAGVPQAEIDRALGR